MKKKLIIVNIFEILSFSASKDEDLQTKIGELTSVLEQRDGEVLKLQTGERICFFSVDKLHKIAFLLNYGFSPNANH